MRLQTALFLSTCCLGLACSPTPEDSSLKPPGNARFVAHRTWLPTMFPQVHRSVYAYERSTRSVRSVVQADLIIGPVPYLHSNVRTLFARAARTILDV